MVHPNPWNRGRKPLEAPVQTLKHLHGEIFFTVINILPCLNTHLQNLQRFILFLHLRRFPELLCNQTQEGCIEKKSLLVKRSPLSCAKGKHLQYLIIAVLFQVGLNIHKIWEFYLNLRFVNLSLNVLHDSIWDIFFS